MANRVDVLRVLRVLSAAYPQFEVRDAQIDVYCVVLADLPAHVLAAAAIQHISSSKWFPTVAELRDCAVELMRNEAGLPTAAAAWGEVKRQIAAVGTYGSPKFTDPITARVVGYLGWRSLCLSQQETADRARFMDAYAVEMRREAAQARMLPQIRELAERLSIASGPRGTRMIAAGDETEERRDADRDAVVRQRQDGL